MTVSSKFSVAVHVLSCLEYARREWGQEQMRSEDLATSANTNPVIIRNLLGELVQANLILSKEGKGGGFRLALPASEIYLDTVYTAVHCPAALTQNPRPEYKPCSVSCGIKNALEPVLDELDRDILLSLRKRTLNEIVDSIVHA